jgi:phosphatidate phosphatase
VGLFGTAGPILFIILVEFLNASLLPCQKKKSSSRWRAFGICVFHSISLFALGISITLLLTEIGKRWIGRLRPHFISVCQPNLSQLNCIGTSSVSGTYYNPIYTGGNFCTNTDISSIREARFSFPSGHSSYSNFTMVDLTN